MYIWPSCAVVVLCVLLPGAALSSPAFLPYEGLNSVRFGTGTEGKKVGGVDFWASGNTPRRYQVIGFLSDQVPILEPIATPSSAAEIAKATKAAGGDAV